LDTIEERIKALQEQKLELAHNILCDNKNISATAKLTIDNLKSLFNF